MTDYVVIEVPSQTPTVVVSEPVNTVVVSTPGPQGPAGATGPPGGAIFEFVQASPSSSWVVNHNLNQLAPGVSINIDGELVETDVIINSANQLTAQFSSPQSGRLTVN